MNHSSFTVEVDSEIAGMIPVFIENLNNDIKLLRAVMSVEDAEETSRAAAKLKSACRAFGFHSLYRIASQIEGASLRQDWGLVHQLFREFNLFVVNLDVVFVQEEEVA